MHFITPTLPSVLCPQHSVETALSSMVSVAFSENSHFFVSFLLLFNHFCNPMGCSPLVGFSDKNTGVDCRFLFQDLPGPGIEPTSPTFASRFFTTEPPGKPFLFLMHTLLFPSPPSHLWLLFSTFTGFLIFYSLFNICVHHSPVITLPFPLLSIAPEHLVKARADYLMLILITFMQAVNQHHKLYLSLRVVRCVSYLCLTSVLPRTLLHAALLSTHFVKTFSVNS